jgi:bifunctional non-homologous end joining protein LigD
MPPRTAANATVGRRSGASRARHIGEKPRSSLRPRSVSFTHTERVLFPEGTITKGDVLDFYQRIAPFLLPYLKNRPMTLERLPEGLSSPKAPHFWQKNTPTYYPSWIPRINIPTEEGKPVEYVLVNDEQTLLYLVNQGTITFHPFLSRVTSIGHPDFVLFDIDISQATFADVVAVTKEIHKQLDDRDAPSFPKTSGKRGLHVLAAWKKSAGYDEARAFAMDVATAVCEALPKIATTERLKASRAKRVYIDVIQNALGHHVVPPYVLRATPEATVSTPLKWSEVNARLDARRFTIKTIFNRLPAKDSDLMAGILP